jgi:hypothetical protein
MVASLDVSSVYHEAASLLCHLVSVFDFFDPLGDFRSLYLLRTHHQALQFWVRRQNQAATESSLAYKRP